MNWNRQFCLLSKERKSFALATGYSGEENTPLSLPSSIFETLQSAYCTSARLGERMGFIMDREWRTVEESLMFFLTLTYDIIYHILISRIGNHKFFSDSQTFEIQSTRLVQQVVTFLGRSSFIWCDEWSTKYLRRSDVKSGFRKFTCGKLKTKLTTTATLNRRK